jgi:hypothetical protein
MLNARIIQIQAGLMIMATKKMDKELVGSTKDHLQYGFLQDQHCSVYL